MSTYIIESESHLNGIRKETVLTIKSSYKLYFELKHYNTGELIFSAKGITVDEIILLINKFKTFIPQDLVNRLRSQEFNKVVFYRKDGCVDETSWKNEEPNKFWMMVYQNYHHNYLQGLKENGVSFIASNDIFTLSFSKKSKIKPDDRIDNSIIMLLRLYLNYIDEEISDIKVNINTFLNEFDKTVYSNGGMQYIFNIENFKEKYSSKKASN